MFHRCILSIGFHSVKDDKILASSKLKAFADNKLNVTENIEFVYLRLENIVEKIRKCWLPAFSSFPKMFSKGLFLAGVKSRNYEAKGYQRFCEKAASGNQQYFLL